MNIHDIYVFKMNLNTHIFLVNKIIVVLRLKNTKKHLNLKKCAYKCEGS